MSMEVVAGGLTICYDSWSTSLTVSTIRLETGMANIQRLILWGHSRVGLQNMMHDESPMTKHVSAILKSLYSLRIAFFYTKLLPRATARSATPKRDDGA